MLNDVCKHAKLSHAMRLQRNMLWGKEFTQAWQTLISQHIMKGTGVKNGQPTSLQLQVQECLLRAAFEKHDSAHEFTRTFRLARTRPQSFGLDQQGNRLCRPVGLR